jgi:hypothetical protein
MLAFSVSSFPPGKSVPDNSVCGRDGQAITASGMDPRKGFFLLALLLLSTAATASVEAVLPGGETPSGYGSPDAGIDLAPGEEDWSIPDPQGEPVSLWKVVPVMPGALAGEEIDGAYIYTVRADPFDVYRFYIETMPDWGWVLFGVADVEEDGMMITTPDGADLGVFHPVLLFERRYIDGTPRACIVRIAVPADSDIAYLVLTRQ